MSFSSVKYSLSVIILISQCLFSFANAESIQEKLAQLETSFDGRVGIYALNTANNQQIEYRANDRFPIQSTFKIMAVSALLKKSLANNILLKQKIIYTKKDIAGWSPMTEKHINNGMTLFDMCAAAVMYSDNTATNLLIKKLGGPQTVTAFARSIGDTTFRVDHWEPNLNSDPNNFQDTSTPKAMGHSLKQLILTQGLPIQQQKQLIQWMKANTTGDARIRRGVPKEWIVADKTGSGDDYGIANDIGVIWPRDCKPIIIAIYSINNKKDAAGRDDIIALATHLVINEFAQTDLCFSSSG